MNLELSDDLRNGVNDEYFNRDKTFLGFYCGKKPIRGHYE
jgi:hypothetical protein